LNAISTFFGSQPRNAQVPPNGWWSMTATRQSVARQRWAATDAAVPCQSGRDGRSEAWRLWQPLQWKRCAQKISPQHHLSLMYHPPPRHAPVARQFDFVIFTASIGGSINTEPHLAVPNRRPAPFILNSPSNRPASEPASGMSIEYQLRNELSPPRQLMLVGHRQHHSEARLAAHHPCVSLWGARKRHCLDHRTHTDSALNPRVSCESIDAPAA